PVIVPVKVPEPKEIDEEEALIRQMEEEAMEEFTFEEPEELTITTDPDQIEEVEPDPDEFIEATLDNEGLYIGPTTVIKGDHLLELENGKYVVIGTFSNYRDAEEYSDQLFIKGFYTKFGYISQTKIYYVYIFESDDLQETKDTSERFRSIGAQFRENWVLQVQ
ncbi:MAG: SPOR domain-containing protein, partial [Cyclobacteriaceae bacterium]|nr:SPOR domain-containing protein [Cyclobacteriaceae bacterium]